MSSIQREIVNQIIQGDCLNVLPSLPENCIDCLVTDPPYGYSFMWKNWDKAVPSIEIWRECLRVLKSGSFMFVMSSPRQDVLSQMIVRIGEAGFKTDFTSIYWTYASGFPKAMNVAKMVDKRLGEKETVINPKTYPDIRCNNYSNSQGKTHLCGGDYLPSANEAKVLDGCFGGFQPKPAVEIVIIAMKPLSEKTYVDQALTNGKGVTWLNDCRIPYISESDKEGARYGNQTWNSIDYSFKPAHLRSETKNVLSCDKGRFPANLLVEDNVLDDGKITKTNVCGGFSRYFDLDAWFSKTVSGLPKEVQKTFPFLVVPKASKSERNKGCENLDNATYLDATRLDKDAIGCNNHPTVKPLKLMSYLVTLGSRPNDLVLDPFCGSGTTCLASKMLGRNYIGIEKEAEYVVLAENRVRSHKDST